MGVRFVGGPWGGRVEDFSDGYGSIRVVDDEDFLGLGYATYDRMPDILAGEPREYCYRVPHNRLEN